ncbi:MAG: helix-turn-helix domain-containing protein [Coriobacteriales bacterium]|jgi:transcriptional regulator with XRE-family HTH domain|nr:helix-turn-helix domain-containing protein [Coriobacteriales bacterium]
MKFGDILRNLLEERSLSQKELARALNMAPSTLGNYIRNEREADYETLKVLARYFGVSVDYLLDLPQNGVLCHEESALLHSFRSLTPEHKDILIDFSSLLLKRSLRIDSER